IAYAFDTQYYLSTQRFVCAGNRCRTRSRCGSRHTRESARSVGVNGRIIVADIFQSDRFMSALAIIGRCECAIDVRTAKLNGLLCPDLKVRRHSHRVVSERIEARLAVVLVVRLNTGDDGDAHEDDAEYDE